MNTRNNHQAEAEGRDSSYRCRRSSYRRQDAEELSLTDNSNLCVLDTELHKSPRVWGCIAAKSIQKEGYPTRLHHLDVLNPFLEKLQNAYADDYNMKSVIEPGHLPIQWCRKLTFTAKTKRSAIQINDYVQYRDGSNNIGRVKQIFVHELIQGAKRIFVYITPLHLIREETDSILQLLIWRVNSNADTEIIVGFPSVGKGYCSAPGR